MAPSDFQAKGKAWFSPKKEKLCFMDESTGKAIV